MYPANPGAKAPGFVIFARMTKIILMIDGGFLRVRARKAGKDYDPAFIERFAKNCPLPSEELLRTLYYDCAPYQGQQKSQYPEKRKSSIIRLFGWMNLRKRI